MAVFTELELADAREFLRGTGISADVTGLEHLAGGIENSNFKVFTEEGVWVLTIFEDSSPEAVEAQLALERQLYARGLCVPAVEWGGGAIGGKPAALRPFVAGRQVEKPSAEELLSIGETLAELHLGAEGLGLEPKGLHLVENLKAETFFLADALDIESAAIADLMKEEAEYQVSRPHAGLPSGFIHGDIFLDNIILREGTSEVAGIIDFAMASKGPWLYDLAVLIFDACWTKGGIDGDLVRALLSGYRNVRPVGSDEFDCLADLLRRAALRFLCLRMRRFIVNPRRMLAGAEKDPLELFEKLVYFRDKLSF